MKGRSEVLRRISVLLFVVFLFFPVWARAQDSLSVDSETLPLRAEAVIQSSSIVRNSPPYGFLNLGVGGKVAELPEGTQVQIIGQRTYPGFSGPQVWYEVDASADGLDLAGYSSVWIFNGTAGSNSNLDLQMQ